MNKIKKLFLTNMLLVACFIFIPKKSLASDFPEVMPMIIK